MVKIRYTGSSPYRHRILTGGFIKINPGTVVNIVPESEAQRLLAAGEAFQKADTVTKVKGVEELNVLSKPSKTVDEKEEAPEEQKPEKKEKVLKAKPKAKKPKLKKDKLRKKLQSKRSKK